jgi:tetratricopeptide (TPR) repeat protein
MGRNKASLESAREAVRLVPDEPMFQWTLARSAAACRDWRLAEQAANATMRLAPDWSMAHGIVGLVAAGRRHRKEAQAHFLNALRLDPNDPEILHNVAVTMPRLRPRTETVQLLEEAVRLDPSDKQIVDNLYIEASGHVRGGGFDRLDVMMLVPFAILLVLNAAIFLGWIHPPAIVSLGAVVLILAIVVAYSIGDFLRNRARLNRLKTGTRALYFRRFYRDHWLSTVFFVVTFGIPALVIGMLAAALGLPGLAQWGVLFAVIIAWGLIGPRTWRTRVHPWLWRNK